MSMRKQQSFFHSGVRGARSLLTPFDGHPVKSVREAERGADSLIMSSTASLELCIRICDMASAGASFDEIWEFITELEQADQPALHPDQTVH
jgi:hypothetical protein